MFSEKNRRHSRFMRNIRLFITLLFSFMLLQVVPLYAGEPTDQMKHTIDSVLDILKNKELKRPGKAQQRRAAIWKILAERFDFEEMAKRSLALHWRERSPEEKKEFVALFSDLLENTYISKIERYEDEKIQYVGENIYNGYASVKTRIITRKNIEIPIGYRLLNENKKWKVYDVAIEGVSLVNNYRTQFNDVINSSSYGELIKRMKKKQEEFLKESP
jgi:phospholipid transport system substrate-binding protein